MTINLPSFYNNWFTKMYIYCRLLILPLAEIESHLPPIGTVLDVGCGFGFTSLYFALSSPHRKVIGLDIRPRRITFAKLAGKNIKNLSFKIDNLAKNQHQKVNAIVIVDLFHHLNRLQKHQLLDQCHHLILSGGKLIIKDINTRPLIFYIWNYLHDLVLNSQIGSGLEFFNVDQMSAILNQHQFKIISHQPLSKGPYPHYLYVCQKE